jgi:hypothetical protein
MGFRGAVTGDDLHAALCAVRDQITADLEACESMRDKTGLYLRLFEVLAKIETLREPTQEGDVVDEISQRRTARRAAPAPRKTRAKRSG